MSVECENRYKICRCTAGLTQEQAAELLALKLENELSVRTLSNYENGHTDVPDKTVDAMAEIYNAPMLGWWHLKKYNILGKYLPDISMPQTNGDMAFQLVLADDELSAAVTSVKKIMSNGKIDDNEWDNFYKSVELIKSVNAKLFSVIVYTQQFILKESGD